MFPLIPSMITGGATLLGGLLTNSSAKAQARRQMEFQERMSNTAMRRMVADARAAGINPMLVAGSGGASTPQGAQAQIGNVLADAATSAVAAHAEARQERFQRAQAGGIQEQNELRGKQRQLTAQQLENLRRTFELLGYQVTGAKAASKFAGNIGQLGPLVQFLMQMFQRR